MPGGRPSSRCRAGSSRSPSASGGCGDRYGAGAPERRLQRRGHRVTGASRQRLPHGPTCERAPAPETDVRCEPRMVTPHERVMPRDPHHCRSRGIPLAVAEGFEPSVRGYRTQHFECCTFGRSDTSPSKMLHDQGFRVFTALTESTNWVRNRQHRLAEQVDRIVNRTASPVPLDQTQQLANSAFDARVQGTFAVAAPIVWRGENTRRH